MTIHVHQYWAHGYFGGVWPFLYQPEGPPSEIYGTLQATENPDVAIFSGLVFWQAILDAVEQHDVAVFTGLVGRIGQLVATEQPDVAIFHGLTGIIGKLEAIEASDVAHFVGAIPIISVEMIALEGRPDSAIDLEGRGGQQWH